MGVPVSALCYIIPKIKPSRLENTDAILLAVLFEATGTPGDLWSQAWDDMERWDRVRLGDWKRDRAGRRRATKRAWRRATGG